MNRRETLKKIFGLATVGVIAPVITESAEQRKRYTDSIGVPTTSGHVPLPEDLRTPEELIADEYNWAINYWTQQIGPDSSRSYKILNRVPESVYEKIKVKLVESGKPIEIRELAGREAVILYGNVLTIIT